MTIEEKRERHRRSNLASYYRNAEKYREYARKYRLANRAKMLEATKKWRCENTEWRKEYRQLNRQRDQNTAKLWKDSNREKVNAQRRKLYSANPEKQRIYQRDRRLRDPEQARTRAREAGRKRRTIHREKWLDGKRQYRAKNRDKINADHRKWNEENRAEVRRKRVAYDKMKFKNDPAYKLSHYIRNRVKAILKGERKCARTLALLGTTIENLRKHLESQFRDGMSWQNYGLIGWHIDHIIPCASFDLTDQQQQRCCFHYTNLQPLWWHENLAKGKRVTVYAKS